MLDISALIMYSNNNGCDGDKTALENSKESRVFGVSAAGGKRPVPPELQG